MQSSQRGRSGAARRSVPGIDAPSLRPGAKAQPTAFSHRTADPLAACCQLLWSIALLYPGGRPHHSPSRKASRIARLQAETTSSRPPAAPAPSFSCFPRPFCQSARHPNRVASSSPPSRLRVPPSSIAPFLFAFPRCSRCSLWFNFLLLLRLPPSSEPPPIVAPASSFSCLPSFVLSASLLPVSPSSPIGSHLHRPLRVSASPREPSFPLTRKSRLSRSSICNLHFALFNLQSPRSFSPQESLRSPQDFLLRSRPRVMYIYVHLRVLVARRLRAGLRKSPRRAPRSIRAPARPAHNSPLNERSCSMHRSPISITRAQPLSDRNSPPHNPLQRPESRTPLGTSTLKPKVVENLRRRPRCETPSPQPLTAAPLAQVNRNTLKGRFASMQQCTIRRCRLATSIRAAPESVVLGARRQREQSPPAPRFLTRRKVGYRPIQPVCP